MRSTPRYNGWSGSEPRWSTSTTKPGVGGWSTTTLWPTRKAIVLEGKFREPARVKKFEAGWLGFRWVGRRVRVFLVGRFVDPGGGGQRGRFGVFADEPFGVAGVGGG